MGTKKVAGITAKLGLDTSGVTSALKEIDKNSSACTAEMKQLDKALTLNPQSTVLMTQKQELLAEQISNTESKMQELTKVADKMGKAAAANADWERQYNPLKEAIDSTKDKLKQLQAQNDKVEADFASGDISAEQYNAYQAEVDETKTKLQQLGRQKRDLEAQFTDGHITAEEYRTYQREVETTRAELQQLQRQQQDTAQSTGAVGDAAGQSARELQEASSSTASYADSLDTLKGSAKDVGDDLKKIGEVAAAVIASIAAVAAAAVAKSTEVGSAYEKSMSKVQALSGATGDDFDALAQKARDMGAATSKTAAESADALSYMALAGWDTQQMLTGLEPILRASEAGEMDLATCSDLVTDSMSAMGVQVEDLNHYLDVCTKAQSSSNTSLQQLLEAYIGCGGTLKNLNVSAEESAAILGTLANRGKKASEAGTALNSLLVNLIGANERAATAMTDLGVSAWDSEGNFVGLSETLKRLSSALADCTDEEKSLFEARIGGKTQMDTLQALISGVSEEYDGLYESLCNCDGALLDTAKTMQDNLVGDITVLSSALEELGISVYDKFGAPMREAVQGAVGEVDKLSAACRDGDLSASLERLAKYMAELLQSAAEFATDKGIPALIDSLEWISTHGDQIIAVVKGIGAGWLTWQCAKLATDVTKLISSLQAYSAAAATATAEQTALNVAQKANVYALIATVAISAATALAGYLDNAGKIAIVESDNVTAIRATTDAIKDEHDSFGELQTAQDESVRQSDKQINKLQEHWTALQSLCDEQGRLDGTYDEALPHIAALNEAYGGTIEVIDGQIQGYDDLKASFAKYIEMQRLEAQLSASKNTYGEAVGKIEGAKSDLDKATADYEAALKQWTELDRAIETRQKLGWTGAEYADMLEQQKEQSLVVNALKQQVTEAEATYSEYNSAITGYEQLLAESYKEQASGEAAAVDEGTDEVVTALDDQLAALEHSYKIHEITEEQYWAQRKALLERNRDEESEVWWGYYDEVTAYYDKLAEANTKGADKASKSGGYDISEAAGADLEALDHKYKTHQLTEEQYWAQRRTTLDKYRDEESEAWWKYYDECTDYFDKSAATAEKSASEAASGSAKSAGGAVDAVSAELTKSSENMGLLAGAGIADGIAEGIGKSNAVDNALGKYQGKLSKVSKEAVDSGGEGAMRLQAVLNSSAALADKIAQGIRQHGKVTLPELSEATTLPTTQSTAVQSTAAKADNTETDKADNVGAKLDKIIALLERMVTSDSAKRIINLTPEITTQVAIDGDVIASKVTKVQRQYKVTTNS